jgi:glutathione synthase/RimK-type ligase-like ATP-grasp enzyme
LSPRAQSRGFFLAKKDAATIRAKPPRLSGTPPKEGKPTTIFSFNFAPPRLCEPLITLTMKIGLLTCQRLPDLTPADQLLIPELAKHNIIAQAVIWDDPDVIWTDFDYLIFRNTWDYYEKESQFNLWLSTIKKLGIKTLNSIDIIEQNKHKFYLRDLQNQKFTIIPTVFIERTKALNLAGIIPSHWKKAVIKPAFSAGSYLTEVFELANIEEINKKYQTIASEKDLLLQEFKPEIETEGETSLIFFNKKFSHAVNKKPKAGDFRIQVQFGGRYNAVSPNAEVIQQAQNIVNNFPNQLLYARVDGIIINNKIELMEVECIEPDLYFNYSEGSHQRFINAILDLIK